MAVIDLRSDTVTMPSNAMREALANAEVGDDVYGEDPSVKSLEAMAAERLGKASALFVPSGTMANQIAIRAHTQPGDALLAGQGAHVFVYESGAIAALSGVQTVLIGDDGLFDADDVKRALSPPDPHFAPTRLVCVENTHNRSGGRVFPLEDQLAVADVARSAGLALHLDGARLFNAAIASGAQVDALARPYDSVAFCLSKGLGAPVGSLICGSEAFIERAHRFRKMFGGGMRQAGILAAAGIFALENNIERLVEDHANARALADGLREVPGIRLPSPVETNMVVFDVDDARSLIAALEKREVRVGAVSRTRIRAVTHMGVSRDDIDSAIAAARACFAG
jgi:threonine aldolase